MSVPIRWQHALGYRTPNIDRIAHEGMIFTDYYAEQSCTAGRSSFITGQCVRFVLGSPKVGIPGSPTRSFQDRDVTMAQLLKAQGYATGQFGKNHLGDLNKYLPTVHGFDEFFGNLYHLNAGKRSRSCWRIVSAGCEVCGDVRPARCAALQGHGHG